MMKKFNFFIFFYLLFVPYSPINADPTPNAWHYIESKSNNLYLDVQGGSRTPKTPIWMFTPNNSIAQQWMLINAGDGYYYIKSRVSGLYLDVKGGSRVPNTMVWQYPLNRSDSQKWKLKRAGRSSSRTSFLNNIFPNYYYLQAKVSGLYLGIPGSIKSSGTQVWQTNFNLSDSLKWRFKPVKRKVVKAKYLGQYPSHRQTGWSDNLQGVGHDQNNWFFTQVNRLWKFPITYNLNKRVHADRTINNTVSIPIKYSRLPNGVKTIAIPESLKSKGYNHFGDLVHHKGYLFIPLEADSGLICKIAKRLCETNGDKPLLAVFHASNLKYIGFAPLPKQTKAGWFAINPINDLLYTSHKNLVRSNKLIVYKVDFNALRTNRVHLTYQRMKPLFDEKGRDIIIKDYMQGGEFSDDGKYLFIINGKMRSNAKDGGIWIFDFLTGRKIIKSSRKGAFKYQYHPGWPKYEEPEGLTYWNLDNRNAPKIKGHLHVILLDQDHNSDEFWLKHYSID